MSLPRLTTHEMAARLATDIPDGAYVNLGIGMPVIVANHVPAGRQVIYHSENGILGVGRSPEPGEDHDPDLINAAKDPVTLIAGGCYFDTAESFAMMRGGHLDLAVLGAFQVSATGDLANWATYDATYPPAVGGAMDLAVGAKTVYVLMRHTTKDGTAKLVETCDLPLTGAACVSRVYTDLGVFEIDRDNAAAKVIERFDGVSANALQAVTGLTLVE